jgi:hypothetical protein
MSRGEA